MKLLRNSMLTMAIAFALVFSGCSLFSGGESVEDPSNGDSGGEPRLLYSEDFSEFELGSVPEGWKLNRADRAYVVADPGGGPGKAVYLEVDPDKQDGDTHLTGPVWDFDGENPARIAYEFKVWWVTGGGAGFYVTGAPGENTQHNLDTSISAGGQLRYRGAEGLKEIPDAFLQDGWNHVRVVADRVKNEAFVYLNDMETPVDGPLVFRNLVETWQGSKFFILNSYSKDNPVFVKTYYTDLKAWILD